MLEIISEVLTVGGHTLYVNQISPSFIYGVFGTFVAILLLFYALRSVGVFVMARRTEGKLRKMAYLAWFPIAWIYLAARLAGKVVVFGKPMKRFALFLVIFFAFAEALTITQFLMTYIPLIGYALSGGRVALLTSVSGKLDNASLLKMLNDTGYYQYLLDGAVWVGEPLVGYPSANNYAIAKASSILSYVDSVVSLIEVVILIFFYIALFKRYYPQHFIIATILSIWIGLFPIFVFAVRKRKPINYNDYMRERINYINSMRAQNNPNNLNNPYAGNNANRPPQPDNPFDDFAEKGERKEDNPFSEFDKKD